MDCLRLLADQNGGYWSTPLGWLLPAVARANFSLAASLLQDALNDSFAHGFNEAVNHDAHYNPPQKFPPQTYQGVHGYLASVASIYGVVWTVRRGAAPSPPLPMLPPPPPPPAGGCTDCQKACAAPPGLSKGASLCSNLTGHWAGTWTGYAVAHGQSLLLPGIVAWLHATQGGSPTFLTPDCVFAATFHTVCSSLRITS